MPRLSSTCEPFKLHITKQNICDGAWLSRVTILLQHYCCIADRCVHGVCPPQTVAADIVSTHSCIRLHFAPCATTSLGWNAICMAPLLQVVLCWLHVILTGSILLMYHGDAVRFIICTRRRPKCFVATLVSFALLFNIVVDIVAPATSE